MVGALKLSGGGPANGSPPLPTLRDELELLQGAADGLGVPTWLIYDPICHRYVQLDEASFEILSAWPRCRTVDDLTRAMRLKHDRTIDPKSIERLIEFFEANQLFVESLNGGWRALFRRLQASKRGPLLTFIYSYLFFRIPLVRPQAFLQRTAWLAAPFFSKGFLWFSVFVGMLGIYLVAREFDAFIATVQDTFTWQGIALFALSLILVKFVHELAHAYAAIRCQCRVPVIGVAFMLLFPLLYTDVTDTWRLRRRKHRMIVDAAGVTAEFVVAAYATLAWAFLPDGVLKGLAFFLATAGWIMSVAINLNPFMRFDGYYLLSDVTGVDNLQPRAFAIGKWWLRELFFGLKAPCPEFMQPAAIRMMVLYAYGVWVYRLFLFIGIAILIYITTFKALGVVLFVVEIIFLIMAPVFREMLEWYKLRGMIMRTRRTLVTLTCVAALIAAAVIPWSTTVLVPGVIAFADQREIYPHRPARLTAIQIETGARVSKGDVLFELSDPGLQSEIDSALRRVRLLTLRVGRMSADTEELNQSLILARELEAARSTLKGLRAEQALLTLRAPITGRVVEIAADLTAGRWVSTEAALALIAAEDRLEATGFVAEVDAWRLQQGSDGVFIADNPLARRARVKVVDVATGGSEEIDLPQLTSVAGGTITVERDDANRLVPTSAYFRLRMSVLAESAPDARRRGQRGILHLNGTPQSFVTRTWRHALKILAREAGA